MIRHIVAIDEAGGFARFGAGGTPQIPWNLPGDKAYYRNHVAGKRLLMGRATYDETRAQQARYNYVLAHNVTMAIVNGETVSSADEALAKNGNQDLWVIGGESVYESTIMHAGELYITRVDGNFACNRFYPNIPAIFVRTSVSEPQYEDGHTYHFEIYGRR